MRIAHRISAPGLAIPPRIILDHEFVLILAGEGRVVLGRRPYPFRPHTLFLIPPFVPHRIGSTPGVITDHIALHLPLQVARPSGVVQ